MAGLTTNTGAQVEESVIEAFVSTIRGDVLRPDDDTYDGARQVVITRALTELMSGPGTSTGAAPASGSCQRFRLKSGASLEPHERVNLR